MIDTKGNFITVDDRVVFVGGPGQGGGSTMASRGGGAQSVEELVEQVLDIPGLSHEQSMAVYMAQEKLSDFYDGPASDVPIKGEQYSYGGVAEYANEQIYIDPKQFTDDVVGTLRQTRGGFDVDSAKTADRLDRQAITLKNDLEAYRDRYYPDEIDLMEKQINWATNRAAGLRGLQPYPWGAQESLEDIVIHEYGHAIMANLQASGRIDVAMIERLDKFAHVQGNTISEIAMRNGKEYFAESFVRYTQGRKNEIVSEELANLFGEVLKQ